MVILRKIAGWVVVLAALGVLLLFAMPSYRQGEASIAGKTAGDFPLEIAGKPGHLTDLKGTAVVPALRRGDPGTKPLGEVYRVAQRRHPGRRRRRRPRSLRKIPPRPGLS